jgi:Xaa-Pro aminopeptidase
MTETMASVTFPRVLPVRERAAVLGRLLEQRLSTILPLAMREAGIDLWLVICQEDDYDPVFTTLIPIDTWAPILQMLIFYDRGDSAGVERINLSMTDTHSFYDKPWTGTYHEEQWPLLRKIIKERNPRRIGINTGVIQWGAGGLTHNLYTQLVETLPAKYVKRLVSAEPLVTRWLATLSDQEVELYDHVVNVAHAVLAECYSRRAITPGVTTTDDLEWFYWQRCADLGLEVAFKPFFNTVRREAAKAQFGAADRTIRAGDLIHSDVGLRYVGLDTDHQQCAYVLRPGETDAPEGLRRLVSEANRLQDVFMSEFRQGLTGNEMLSRILTRARAEGIPNPKVYSHSLGHFLHEPGPLIGLPWEQKCCPGRGDVPLELNYSFTAELNVRDVVPEWEDQEVTMGLEEDVVFTESGCRPLDGRQTALYLI